MMGTNQVYCSYCLPIYVNPTIIVYTLNLYSGACQLDLNKTGKVQLKNKGLLNIEAGSINELDQ